MRETKLVTLASALLIGRRTFLHRAIQALCGGDLGIVGKAEISRDHLTKDKWRIKERLHLTTR